MKIFKKKDKRKIYKLILIPIRNLALSIVLAPTKLHSERRSKTEPANDSAVIRRDNGCLNEGNLGMQTEN